MTPQEILEIKFYSGDLNKKVTIREYFYKIMQALWDEGESFSGKRPLGNSGWEGDFIGALIKEGVLEGKIDEDGMIEEHDWDESHKFVAKKIIPALFGIVK